MYSMATNNNHLSKNTWLFFVQNGKVSERHLRLYNDQPATKTQSDPFKERDCELNLAHKYFVKATTRYLPSAAKFDRSFSFLDRDRFTVNLQYLRYKFDLPLKQLSIR